MTSSLRALSIAATAFALAFGALRVGHAQPLVSARCERACLEELSGR